MKVRELVAILNTKNQDAEVLVYSDIDEGFDEAYGVCTPQEYDAAYRIKYPNDKSDEEYGYKLYLPYCKGYSINEHLDDNHGKDYVIVGIGVP